MHPPINGTEQRLDYVLEELKALRRLLEKPEKDKTSDDSIPLREPAKPRGRPKKATD